MKLPTLLCILGLFTASASTFAAEFPWEGVGTIHVEIPEGWASESGKSQPVGATVKATAGKGKKASIQMTFIDLPKPLPDKAALDQIFSRGLASVLPNSVEGKADVKALEVESGFGLYTQLTDKSLVGKEVTEEEYRMLRVVHVSKEPKLLVIATLLFDEAAQPEVEQMMNIMKTLKVKPAP